MPAAVGQPSPIKYCIYIIKENRTYDQFLGDLPQGNGDPSLCLFPEKRHAQPSQARAATLCCWTISMWTPIVSADGHEWSMGAYATDFVKKTWPLNYGHNRGRKYPYPSEGMFPIAAPGRRLSLGPRARGRRHLPQLRRICRRRQKSGRPEPEQAARAARAY